MLKCDIRKFFASIDHDVLANILRARIPDENILWLLGRIVESFTSTGPAKGLPLGNLTSQLLVNIYMNEFDQFTKHVLKARYYIRYADDFAFLSHDRKQLEDYLPRVETFLHDQLKLSLHPDKVHIRTFVSGVDFLGWTHFPDHSVLRAATKRRMFRALAEESSPDRLTSYSGMLTHGNARKLQAKLNNPNPSSRE